MAKNYVQEGKVIPFTAAARGWIRSQTNEDDCHKHIGLPDSQIFCGKYRGTAFHRQFGQVKAFH